MFLNYSRTRFRIDDSLVRCGHDTPGGEISRIIVSNDFLLYKACSYNDDVVDRKNNRHSLFF